MHMLPIILSSVACQAVKNFPYYIINGTIFEKVIEHKMCVLIFSTHFVGNISLSEKN